MAHIYIYTVYIYIYTVCVYIYIYAYIFYVGLPCRVDDFYVVMYSVCVYDSVVCRSVLRSNFEPMALLRRLVIKFHCVFSLNNFFLG